MIEAPVLRVSEAIEVCNRLLSELEFKVEGEVSSYTLSRGKFVFFDLKDEQQEALLPCFMMAHQLSTVLEDGMRVVVTGRPGLYQKSGKFRFQISRVEVQGEGSLRRAFQLLLGRLEKEGLFDPARKRPLPRFPRHVGIVSSSEAAGFGDFMKIVRSRLPGVHFRLAHVAVQGQDAEREICAAIDQLNSYYDLDAIVLLRGGGSIEDLQAFNSEPVARAIVRSKAPLMTGIGHERDITIADYCADVRAATPTNAAQLLIPTKEEVIQEITVLTQRGRSRMGEWIRRCQEHAKNQVTRMHQQLKYEVARRRIRVQGLLQTIDAMSPERTLQRGYSLTWDDTGVLITDSAQVKKGANLTTRLRNGEIQSTVT